MDLYEKIRDYITDKNYIPQTKDDLYEKLGGISDAAEFNEALSTLFDGGLIVFLKKGKISSTEKSGYIRGIYRANPKKFGFLIPEGEYRKQTGGDLYVSAEYSVSESGELAVNDDIVLAAMISPVRAGDAKSGEARIIRIIERQIKSVVGALRELPSFVNRSKVQYYVKPDDRHINFIVKIDNIEGYAVGDKVEVLITEYPTQVSDASGRILCSFGAGDSSEANYNAILHESGVKTIFDADTLTEAEKVSREEISADGRCDLRGKLIFTIDGADAKDLDDAISVEKSGEDFMLGVHIADVSHYVKDESPLDREAMERGTSVYFADRVIPMLPESLSNGCCSLSSGTDKYALSAFITVTADGEISGCEIKETIINTAVRGVYSELNDVIAHGKDSAHFDKYRIVSEKMLSEVLALYEILDKKSVRRGALELDSSETKIIIEDGAPVDIVKNVRGLTERVIEQFMLCANEAVAEWLFWQDMPCVYRIHESPSPEKIQIFKLFAHNLGLNTAPLNVKNIRSSSFRHILEEARQRDTSRTVSYMLLRSMMKAKYSATAHPHFGLSVENYCHFTSPIRRYPDLTVHRIVKAVLCGKMTDDYYTKMVTFAESSAEESTENEQKAVSAERDIENLYKTVFMQKHIGEVFEGVISSVAQFGFFVELDNTCEGLVTVSSLDGYFTYDERSMTLSCGYTVYALGKRVNVVISGADIISRRVEMEIVSETM